LNPQLKAVQSDPLPRTAQLWLPEASISWMICLRASITRGVSVRTTIPAVAGVAQAGLQAVGPVHLHHADSAGPVGVVFLR
jgi:hypothetical protein